MNNMDVQGIFEIQPIRRDRNRRLATTHPYINKNIIWKNK